MEMNKRVILTVIALLGILALVHVVSGISGFSAIILKANSSFTNSSLTIFDDTDTETRFNTDITSFFANYTNSSNSSITPAQGGNCEIFFNFTGDISNPLNQHGMDYNATTGLYVNSTIVRTGYDTFTVNCTSSIYSSANVTDDYNITNRIPVILQNISEIHWFEDFFNDTLNLSVFFSDPDNANLNDFQALNFSFELGSNISATVTNSILNITNDLNFFGSSILNITAFDIFGGSVTMLDIVANITNTPEVELQFPLNNTQFSSAQSLTFTIKPFDVNASILNCSLLLDGNISFTETNITASSEILEIRDDDGEGDAFQIMGQGAQSDTKQLYINQTITKLKILMEYVGTGQDFNYSINNGPQQVITTAEFIAQLPSAGVTGNFTFLFERSTVDFRNIQEFYLW